MKDIHWFPKEYTFILEVTLSCKLLIYILPVQQIYRNTAGNVNGTSFSKRILFE